MNTTEVALQSHTSVAVRILLGILAATEAIVGVWAQFAPASFYRSFPGVGYAWVSLLPPYNEHLIRDVGSLSLALTVLLAAAAVTGQRLLSAIAVAAFVVYTVPHMIFHSFHLEGFSTTDAVAQTMGFVLQLVVAAVAAWLLWRDRPRRTKINQTT
jgi:fucose 4-O-acetylase-like acetyltransferase